MMMILRLHRCIRRLIAIVLAVVFGYGSLHAGQDLKSEEVLKQLLGKMDAIQKYHSTLYPEFRTGISILTQGTYAFVIDDLPGFENEERRGIPAVVNELVCRSDITFVGSVEGMASNLIDDGSFLFTDYRFRVINNLRTVAPVKPERVLVTRIGGSLRINGREYVREAQDFPRLELRKIYLLFGSYLSKTGTVKTGVLGGSFWIEGSTIRRLGPARNAQERLLASGMDANEFIRLVSDVIAQGCR
jgi:hypothetical protein